MENKEGGMYEEWYGCHMKLYMSQFQYYLPSAW